MLKGKNILVGICGGIAAYKAVDAVSRLVKLNANVDVIMTNNACEFVTPLTLRSISGRSVVTDMFREPENWDTKHISLADKADLLVIAPATANIIGKAACGIADDMLSTVIMAVKSPVLFVPAMNSRMYENPVLKENISKLEARRFIFMEPDEGRLACGSYGKGRLPEPQRIVDEIINIIGSQKDMSSFKVLITAGPTIEPIDPVRYISNHSSGKMGYALARDAYERGAKVKVISGPVHIQRPAGIDFVSVTTTEEMYEAVSGCCSGYDIIIFAAAVSDYRSAARSASKIKKSEKKLTVELVRNPDIAGELGKNKNGRVHIGFAAETERLKENALIKIESKSLDMIAANDVTKEGAGFGTDTNIITLYKKDGEVIELPLMSKKEAAGRILDEALKIHNSINGGLD